MPLLLRMYLFVLSESKCVLRFCILLIMVLLESPLLSQTQFEASWPKIGWSEVQRPCWHYDQRPIGNKRIQYLRCGRCMQHDY